MRRLYRSRTDVIIGGVAAGLGEYFDLDPTLVRLVWLLSAFMGGWGVLVYLLAWILIPPGPPGPPGAAGRTEGPKPAEPPAEPPRAGAPGPPPSPGDGGGGSRQRWAGVVLLLAGALLMAREVVPWLDLSGLWPLLLIGLGAALILREARR